VRKASRYRLYGESQLQWACNSLACYLSAYLFISGSCSHQLWLYLTVLARLAELLLNQHTAASLLVKSPADIQSSLPFRYYVVVG
jgi:hypothetical protein